MLAITRDPFIAYTSNAFAILGLRALYFALADSIGRVHYLQMGLAAILVFVGMKMITAEFVHISPLLSLGIIASILIITVAASLIRSRSHHNAKK